MDSPRHQVLSFRKAVMIFLQADYPPFTRECFQRIEQELKVIR